MRNDKTLLSREEEQFHGHRIQTAAVASKAIIKITKKFIDENRSSTTSSEILEIMEAKKNIEFNFVKIGEIGELLLLAQTHLTSAESKSISENLEVVKEGHVSKDEMITRNRGLVRKLASTHINQNVPLDDLTQVGTEGLMRAVEKFDPNRGYKFSTYARDWIKSSINRYVDDQHTIQVPEYQLHKIARIRKVQDELLQATGQTPQLEIVAEECGMDVREVEKLLAIQRDARSLDGPVGGGDTTLGGLIIDTGSKSVEELVEEAMANGELRNAIEALKQADQEIIISRFGLDGKGKKTLEEIGKRQGITKQAVALRVQKILVQLGTFEAIRALHKTYE
tara:strand:- start:111 stop:1124 length:1014 start_codon:yes stop_codon:yes gene_type:complete